MHVNPTDIHRHHSDSLRHPLQTPSRQHKTPTDKKLHHQTPPHTSRHPKMLFKDVWQCLLTSFGVCWCLLESVGIFWPPDLFSDVFGVWRGCLRASEWCLWMSVGFVYVGGYIWVFSPCKVEQSLYVGIALTCKIVSTWHFWDIKISKCLCIGFPKNIGLCNFGDFLGLSERNYNLQL